MMKRTISMFLVVVIAIISVGCGKKSDSLASVDLTQEEANNVHIAISALEEHWRNSYSQPNAGDGYFEIFHTRIVKIDAKEGSKFQEMFEKDKKIDYLIEFELYTDFCNTAPYYENASIDDTVIIYHDGTTKVDRDVPGVYRRTTYNSDYSDFLVYVKDLGTAFNQKKTLK